MKKSVVCAAAFVFLCLALWCLPAIADLTSNELIRKVHPCTVRIHVFDANGKPAGQGSGFLYKSAGRLITNYHVLGNAAMAKVRFNDGREYSIKSILAEDKANDVIEAMVDVPPGEVRWLMPSSTPPRAGENVMVIGSPMGVEKAISEGKVTAIRNLPGYGNAIIHSAHSFPGSSGSPLVNAQGELVGIESAGIPGRPDINFALPLPRFASMPQAFRQLKATPAAKTTARSGNEQPDVVQREKQIAESGDPAALIQMALRYEQGQGVAKNCTEALRLYRKAADQGDIQAQFHLGRLYYDGKCVTRNFAEASKWLKRAADRGLPDAQRSFGLMFFNGEGMPRDKQLACTWMILAAARKNEDAQRLLRLIAAEMTKEEFTAAQEKAKNWRPVK
ncbi:MAG: trypsin-like peptidase domain-containing protein [Syntrophobacteraceae bacterium]